MNTNAHQTSRRNWLATAAMSSLAALPSVSAAELLPIKRVGGASLKPALNAYSFLELLNANLKNAKDGIDLFGVCDFCAIHNIEAIDLTGYFFPGYPNKPRESFIARIKKYTHDLGLVISGTGIRNDFATADKAVRAAGVKHAQEWIEVAAQLGAPVLRVFAGPRDPHDPENWQAAAGNATREDVEAWMADDLRDCAEHGEKLGVIVAVQNHGDFLNTGQEHLRLLKRVAHPWCGPLVDTGKYLTDDPYSDISMMVPYAVNWQIKETLGSSTKSPNTDFKKLIRIIHDGGYRGFLPIETLAMNRQHYDPFVEVEKALVAMRDAVSELSQ